MYKNIKSKSSNKTDREKDFKKLIKDDLINIRKIRNYCTSNPRIDNWMRSIINKHPFQDIVIVLYLFFAVGLVDIGKKHFWVVVTNISVAFCKFISLLHCTMGRSSCFLICHCVMLSVLRRIIEAKRPVEYDRTMQPMTDRGADSYG
jgi:hypothetical protein